MKNRDFGFLVLVFFLGLSVQGWSQVLAIDPDDMKAPTVKATHLGTTLSGSSGLLTIPTPDFQEDRQVSLTYTGGISKGDLTLGTGSYRISKDEHFTGLAWNVKPNLELTAMNLRYERSSDPALAGLNYREDATTFGMKYSTQNGDQDFCMGFSYAPMSAAQLNNADLMQVETLRNAYMTVTEEIASGFYGHLNLKESFTDKQKIDLGNGQTFKMNPKQFLVSGIGLEYVLKDAASIFCEGKFYNYRDLFREGSDQFSFNAGLRFGLRNIQLEVLGFSLNQNPVTYLGGSVGF